MTINSKVVKCFNSVYYKKINNETNGGFNNCQTNHQFIWQQNITLWYCGLLNVSHIWLHKRTVTQFSIQPSKGLVYQDIIIYFSMWNKLYKHWVISHRLVNHLISTRSFTRTLLQLPISIKYLLYGLSHR